MNIKETISAIGWKWLIYALLFAGYAFIHSRLHGYAFDDAYIHFRVARNLAETGIPYFNVNEMVKVSTSSGWTIFLACIFMVARIIHLEDGFSLIVGLLNAAITLWGMFTYTRIVRKLLTSEPPPLQTFMFQLAFLALLAPSSIGLMETPLAILAAGLGIDRLLSSRREGYVLLGFAAYIRLELLVLLVLIGVVLILQKQFTWTESILYIGAGLAPVIC